MQSTGIRALTKLVCLALSAIPLPAAALLGGAVDAREDFGAVVALTLGETPRCSATKHHFTSRFPDVAILSVRERTASIPLARVDCEPLHPGDAVQLVGYASLKDIALAARRTPSVGATGAPPRSSVSIRSTSTPMAV